MKQYQNLLISIIICICYLVFFPVTILSTVTLWSTSETYAHGFLVVPIVVWLLYRDRHYFLAYQAKASWVGLILTIGALLLWLVGQTFEISVFSQLGFFAGIVASHWMIFGNRFVKRYQFPMFYLIFAVPMGNMLIPHLQQVTAEITVFMLQLSTIPVYFEGLYITIPTGKFEVAVACSGIRYLIASLAVGTLYAYLSYRKLYKQLIFVVFSLLIPIVANGIRAYLIVLIAHLSEMKYATGADHLIYGWLFFGFIIVIMFYIGGFFIDPENTDEAVTEEQGPAKYNVLPAVFALVLVISIVLVNRNIDITVPPEQPAAISPSQLTMFSADKLAHWGIDFKHSFAQFSGINAQGLELFVAKYANRQTVGELVTSSNKVYGINRWSRISKTDGRVAAVDGDINYTQVLIVSLSGQQRVVRYWYNVNHKLLASPTEVKLNQAYLALKNSTSPVYFYALSKSFDADNPSQGLLKVDNERNHWMAQYIPRLLAGDMK